MGKAAPSPDKRVIIDALVLAFSHSESRNMVGTDALRSVLDVEYEDMMSGGVFDLAPVWELLEQQPDFDRDAAMPPLCAFKSWEKRLGIEVAMPPAMTEVSPSQRALHAKACRVPMVELRELLGGGSTPTSTASPRSAPRKPGRSAVAAEGSGSILERWIPPERRGLVGAVAGAVAALCIVIVGYTVWESMSGGAAWQDVSAETLAGDLPVAGAERLGPQVSVTLDDPGWMANPREQRETQLAEVLRALRPQGVRVLIVQDDGDVTASAQFVGAGDSIEYRFH